MNTPTPDKYATSAKKKKKNVSDTIKRKMPSKITDLQRDEHIYISFYAFKKHL